MHILIKPSRWILGFFLGLGYLSMGCMVKIDGPSFGVGIEYRRDFGWSPKLQCAYHHGYYETIYGLGWKTGISFSPLNKHGEIWADIHGGALIFTGTGISPMHLRALMSIQDGGIAWGIAILGSIFLNGIAQDCSSGECLPNDDHFNVERLPYVYDSEFGPTFWWIYRYRDSLGVYPADMPHLQWEVNFDLTIQSAEIP